MVISKDYHSKISIPELFAAWISPKMLIHPVTKIDVKPQVGGHLILQSESAQGLSVMKGEFLELEQDRKLKYTWHWEGSDETTIVTIVFGSEGQLSTINLRHEGFLTKESMEMHDDGWDYYVSALEKKLKAG